MVGKEIPRPQGASRIATLRHDLKRAADKSPRELRAIAIKYLLLVRLSAVNRYRRSSILGDAPVAVSLTTYGERLSTVHLGIESIAMGSERPRRLILWIDDDQALRSPPMGIVRLQRRGLEVRRCLNYGPHKKYFPYAQMDLAHAIPLAIADDDVIYPRGWLEGLLAAWRDNPLDVSGYRARVVRVASGQFSPYRTWPLCTDTEPSFRNFVTGVSGAIIPPKLLDNLREAGSEFESTCPTADDVWLHYQAVKAEIEIRQVTDVPMEFPVIPGTQRGALMNANMNESGNDDQIQAAYGASEIERISAGRVSR